MSSPKINTQLSDYSNYDPSRMLFKNTIGTVPGQKLTYQRVNISTINDDGTQGDLIFRTPGELFSFGICESFDLKTNELTGYSLPLCLYSKDAPTDEEKLWVENFNRVVERAQSYVLENKKALKKFDLDTGDFKKFNPIYLKRNKETWEIVGNGSPTLYPKLITTRGKGETKIISMFRDQNGDEIDPMTLITTESSKKYCYVTAAIKIESVFIGSKISLQVKLYEAEVRRTGGDMKRLLPSSSKPSAPSLEQVALSLANLPVTSTPAQIMATETKISDDDSSESEEEKPPAPLLKETVKNPIARRVVNKK